MQVTGIDGRPAYVEKAQELVNLLDNATVIQQDIRRLSDEVVSPSSFDLVHARFLVSKLSPQEYPAVLTALVRRCRADGTLTMPSARHILSHFPVKPFPACTPVLLAS